MKRIGLSLLLLGFTSVAQAAWVSTGFVDFDIRMDNGVTFFYPALPNGSQSWPLGGNCLYSRLEINNAGDKFGSVDNAKRMMALLLTAKTSGLKANFGYDDAEGPSCRLAQVFVQWRGNRESNTGAGRGGRPRETGADGRVSATSALTRPERRTAWQLGELMIG